MSLKHTPFYRESRSVYRALVRYGKPATYLRNRFFYTGIQQKVIDRLPTDRDISLHMLTSHADVRMLLFALASWYRVTERVPEVWIHDDGTLGADDLALLGHALPHAKVVRFAEANEQAQGWLAHLPHTRRFRDRAVKTRQGILMLKLVDTFFISSSPKRLILDTDVLWFKNPSEVFDALDTGASFAMNGHGTMDFRFADGTALSSHLTNVNSGIIGYGKPAVTPALLEAFCERLTDKTNPHFIEQAGFATVLGERVVFLPDTYHIKGSLTPDTVAKHYTGPRRELYWIEGIEKLRPRL